MERSQHSSSTLGSPLSAPSCVPKPRGQGASGIWEPKASRDHPSWQRSPIPPQEAAVVGALPDDGVHAPHLRGALQHTEGLRKGVALVG